MSKYANEGDLKEHIAETNVLYKKSASEMYVLGATYYLTTRQNTNPHSHITGLDRYWFEAGIKSAQAFDIEIEEKIKINDQELIIGAALHQ